MKNLIKNNDNTDCYEDCDIALFRIKLLNNILKDTCNYPYLSIENKSICHMLQSHLNKQKKRIHLLKKKFNSRQNARYPLRFKIQTQLRRLDKSIISLYTNQSWQSPSLTSPYNQGINKPFTQYEYHRMDLDRTRSQQKLNQHHKKLPQTFQETLLVNSGMGAFTLIITTLLDHINQTKNYISVGKNSYFEILLFFKENTFIKSLFIAENNINEIIKKAEDSNCIAINLDVITNTLHATTINLKTLFSNLKKIKRSTPLYLLLDTTLAGPNFQCSDYLKTLPNFLHIMLYKSLQKFDQYGDDKVSGGMLTYITNKTNSPLALNKYRGILGINIPEINIHSLCNNKLITEKRYNRINRNGELIFKYLKQYKKEFKKISFNNGGVVFIQYHYTSKNNYEKKINSIIKHAFEQGLLICNSSSFGFNYTHLMYLEYEHEKFIRLAPGMEFSSEIQTLNPLLRP